MVEDWAKSHWSEWFVVFSCDHEVMVEHLFELLDLFELELSLCGALLEVEWPLGVEKGLPLVLDRLGVVWEFVCSEPFVDGF